MEPPVPKEVVGALVTAHFEKIRMIREFISSLGFHYVLDSSDKYGITPLIKCEEFYSIVMNHETCDQLINKLREYRMKAFK